MDKNKSIDGLTTKDAKKSAASNSKSKSKTRVSVTPVTSPIPKSSPSITPKSSRTTTVKSSSTKSSRTKSTPRAKSNTTRTNKSSSRTNKKPTVKPTINSTAAKLTAEPPITPPSEPSTKVTPPINSESPLSKLEPSSPIQTSSEDFLNPTQAFNFDEETGELKAGDPSSTSTSQGNPKKTKKVKKPVSKKRKIITSIILAIVILLIGAVTWLILWGNDIIAKITGGQGNVFDLITFAEPTYEPLKTDKNGRTNILAFGTSGYNMEGEEGNGVHDGAQLTDSIMVISLNQDTGDVAMLSLPRDLKASPTCTATGKINEVYWCKNMDGDNEQAGAEALMEEVGDILGVDFQYYAHLNWGSLVQIVDTLGGITVTLDEDIEDYYYTGAVFEAGKEYTIDGEQALGLARARHGTASGDFSRGASQQKILIGIKNKIFEKQLSLTDLIGLANTLGDNLRTNFNVEEIKTFAHLASEYDFTNMRQVSLLEPEMLMTTGEINGISYVLPAGGANYYTRIRNFVAKMFSNNPSVYEDATILILNGTETPGLASTEQKALEEAGFENITIDDAPAGTYEGQYTLYVLDDTTPATQKLLEEKYSTTAQSFDTLPADIPTNYNLILILGETDTQE